MILYSVNGIFETEQNGILTYKDKPGKVKIVIGGVYRDSENLYNDPAGVEAQLKGDTKTAEKYRVMASDLLLMKWKKRYEADDSDASAELRRRQKEAAEAQEAERIRRMKKDGTYKQWKEKQDRAKSQTIDPSHWENFGKTLISHILPNITKAGYYFEFYNYSWPNPEVRLFNSTTKEWDDEGICSGRNGYFNLFELADLFGDPCANDPARQCKDPNTGRVLGSHPTFDPAKTVPISKTTDE